MAFGASPTESDVAIPISDQDFPPFDPSLSPVYYGLKYEPVLTAPDTPVARRWTSVSLKPLDGSQEKLIARAKSTTGNRARIMDSSMKGNKRRLVELTLDKLASTTSDPRAEWVVASIRPHMGRVANKQVTLSMEVYFKRISRPIVVQTPRAAATPAYRSDARGYIDLTALPAGPQSPMSHPSEHGSGFGPAYHPAGNAHAPPPQYSARHDAYIQPSPGPRHAHFPPMPPVHPSAAAGGPMNPNIVQVPDMPPPNGFFNEIPSSHQQHPILPQQNSRGPRQTHSRRSPRASFGPDIHQDGQAPRPHNRRPNAYASAESSAEESDSVFDDNDTIFGRPNRGTPASSVSGADPSSPRARGPSSPPRREHQRRRSHERRHSDARRADRPRDRDGPRYHDDRTSEYSLGRHRSSAGEPSVSIPTHVLAQAVASQLLNRGETPYGREDRERERTLDLQRHRDSRYYDDPATGFVRAFEQPRFRGPRSRYD